MIYDHNIDVSQLCLGCMENKGEDLVCPYCGYDKCRYTVHPSHLPLYSVLNKKYVVGKVLGQGGFGITYIGFDIGLDRKVAIKEFFPKILASRNSGNLSITPFSQQQTVYVDGLRLFLKEAKTIAKFEKHQNIVAVYELFEEHDTAYIIMEFLKGESLDDRLAARGDTIAFAEAINILLPILEALKSLHNKNYYHRDVSPQNIIITDEGRPVLIDFGAARQIIGGHTKSLDVILKPGYSPFEQYTSNGKIGPWTDVYACGATLYRMISGVTPPPAPDRKDYDPLNWPLDIPELRPQVLANLNDTILRSLSVSVKDRFQTVEEFDTALRKIIPEKQESKPEKQPEPETSPPVIQPVIPQVSLKNRHKPLLFSVAILIIIVSGYLFLSFVAPKYFPSQTPTYFLLNRAEAYYKKNNFLTPEHANAFELCQIVLQRNSANRSAREKLYNILEKYKEWGNIDFAIGNDESAKKYYENYLQVAEYMLNELGEESLRSTCQEVRQQLLHISARSVEPKIDFLTGMEFVWIPPGDFQMGQSSTERQMLIEEFGEKTYQKAFLDELPRHKVRLDGFWMGRYEVTLAQWVKFMGENPSYFKDIDPDRYPVQKVSWNDIQEFLRKLNQKSEDKLYRLPSEAEWEYAARAGTNTVYYFGDHKNDLEQHAWYQENSQKTIHPVGQLQPNAWGLHDMYGNVWEWCADPRHEDYQNAPEDGRAWETDGNLELRTARGGSWSSNAASCRSATRYKLAPKALYNTFGFRLVLEAPSWTP